MSSPDHKYPVFVPHDPERFGVNVSVSQRMLWTEVVGFIYIVHEGIAIRLLEAIASRLEAIAIRPNMSDSVQSLAPALGGGGLRKRSSRNSIERPQRSRGPCTTRAP